MKGLTERTVMHRARDIMHVGAECIDEGETLLAAARQMRDLGVGALPICGTDDRLHGMITDRDIVVHCVAEGYDPGTMLARELADDNLVWVDADADESVVLSLMERNQIRRLPVIDDHRLVGMISEADLARTLDDEQIAGFAEHVYAAG
jgi:CBS domain-containing protein